MENELEIKRVPFMGAELMAARDTDGQIWAGVRLSLIHISEPTRH